MALNAGCSANKTELIPLDITSLSLLKEAINNTTAG